MSDRFKSIEQPQITHLSVKSNELNDFCIESLRDIVHLCRKMRTFDVSENLFIASIKELTQLRYHFKVSFKD